MRVTQSPQFFRKSILAAHSDVKLVGSELQFPDSWDDEAIAKFMIDADASTKTLPSASMKAYKPTSTDIATVKGLMLDDNLDVNKFGFFRIYASDTLVDLQDERATKALLEELALQYKAGVAVNGQPGQSLLINHGINSFAGATFDAEVLPIEGSMDQFALWIKAYVPDMLMFNGNRIVDLVNTRTISKASMQFRPGQVSWKEVGDKYIGILDSSPDKKAVAIELSLVYKGAVEGGHVSKELQGSPKSVIVNRVDNMGFFTKTLEHGEGNNRKSFTVKVNTGENPTVEGLDEVNAEMKSLSAENARLKKAELDSKKPLVDAVLALQKKLKQPEDTENYLQSLDYVALDNRKKHLEALDKTANPKSQTTGADSRQPEQQEEAAAPAAKSKSFFDDWSLDQNEEGK